MSGHTQAYDIVSAKSMEQLAEKVDDKCAEGWVVHGFIVTWGGEVHQPIVCKMRRGE
jgi:hypothetical protein